MTTLAETLGAVHELVTRAREVLDGPAVADQAHDAQRVLATAEELLGGLVTEASIDGHTAQVVLSLRDQLAGYLLASELLADIDHLREARLQVLGRGAVEATVGLDGLLILTPR